MNTPSRPRLKSITPTPSGPSAAPQPVDATAVGGPKVAARKGAPTALRSNPLTNTDGALRVLVTGSRDWPHPDRVRRELSAAHHTATGTLTVIHGACPTGADRAAADWAADMRADGHDVTAEAHPADWSRHGKAAGPRRNMAMVRTGAGLCLAFIHQHSPGASHAARTAEAASIPTLRFTTTPHDGDPTPKRPGIRIYAPPAYRDHYDGARWSLRHGDTPTAAYACHCGQICTAVGASSVTALPAAYTAHTTTCTGTPATLTERRTAA